MLYYLEGKLNVGMGAPIKINGNETGGRVKHKREIIRRNVVTLKQKDRRKLKAGDSALSVSAQQNQFRVYDVTDGN